MQHFSRRRIPFFRPARSDPVSFMLIHLLAVVIMNLQKNIYQKTLHVMDAAAVHLE